VLLVAADMKRCGRCHQVFPRTKFRKRGGVRNDLESYCIPCDLDNQRERRRAKGIPPKGKTWTREDHKAYHAKWREEHREQYRACSREAKRREAERDPDRVRQRRKAWEARRPEVLKAGWAKHTPIKRARKSAVAVVPFTAAELQARLSMFGHRCWICGDPYQAVDHVKPLAKGGLHVLANLRPICHVCNSRKKDQWPYPVKRLAA
jgi:5-methylcytosine-specific restriction endonuclease McrA